VLDSALARGMGRSPEEVVERALEAAAGGSAALSPALGPGLRIQDLIHEGHKY